MNLVNGIIRPGMIVDVLDNGIIKATAPGLFSFNDNPEKLPPIFPWAIGNNANAFSKPKLYDTIWILNFNDNPQELFWFRKDDITVNENISLDGENVEILCNKDIDNGWATIYFSDGSGWVICHGESIIQIDQNGYIVLDTNTPNRCIDINANNISIGSRGKSAHPAAYGDTIESILISLCSLLSSVGTKAMSNPHTVAIGTELLSKLPKIVNKVSDVSSTHITID